MRYRITSSLLLFLLPLQLLAAEWNWNSWHTPEEIRTFARETTQQRPVILGYSVQHRPIEAFVLPAKRRPNLRVLLSGAYHGNEPISAEVVVYWSSFVQALRKKHHNLDDVEFWMIPVANPDGMAANRRENALGQDMNRLFPMDEKRTPSPSPETNALMLFLERYPVDGALAFHTGAVGVYWPACFTGKATPDDASFRALAQEFATSFRTHNVMQSYFDYPSEGEFIDYAYFRHHVFALTVELSGKNRPSGSLVAIEQRAAQGILAFVEKLKDIKAQPGAVAHHH